VIPTSLAGVAEVTGGRLDAVPDPSREVTGPVVIDSREAAPGSLFVALAGERADGHDFAAAAVQGGAVAVLAERPVGVPAVVVGSAVQALADLARDAVGRVPALDVVAVTGSSGKTSTKDLLAHVLARRGPLVAPPGSFNNDVGLPLTALRVDAATCTLVVEMGARGPGHIARLCAVTPPDVGVVLNVGTAHLGEFGSRDRVAAAKGELVEALPPTGTAVLNADDPLVAAMASRTGAGTLRFGAAAGADVRATGIRLDDEARPRFLLHLPDGSAEVALALHGTHHVDNALAAAAAAHALGLAPDEVAGALGTARPASRWRMEVTRRADGLVVVNDAYNANPESVRAALAALAAMRRGRRTWAVLGEMRELGAGSAVEHEDVGRAAARLGIARVVAVGEAARPLLTGARAGGDDERGTWVPDVDAAIALLAREAAPGDVVLVKASRAIGLERVAAALLGGPEVPA
jgi:UDP-N-acetylmuramoyl-tripeptide--D-alanyl-D-alanine ligase